jgi:hypothetical protein
MDQRSAIVATPEKCINNVEPKKNLKKKAINSKNMVFLLVKLKNYQNLIIIYSDNTEQ